MSNNVDSCVNYIKFLTEQRQSISTIYLSVNTAIIGAIAFLLKDGQLTGVPQSFALLLLLGTGVVVCDLWRRLIYQYKALLNWWYEQLRNIETNDINSPKLFSNEYTSLYIGQKGHRPIGLTQYQVRLTWLFTLVYVIFGVAVFIATIR